jgi:hypothetical protein
LSLTAHQELRALETVGLSVNLTGSHPFYCASIPKFPTLYPAPIELWEVLHYIPSHTSPCRNTSHQARSAFTSALNEHHIHTPITPVTREEDGQNHWSHSHGASSSRNHGAAAVYVHALFDSAGAVAGAASSRFWQTKVATAYGRRCGGQGAEVKGLEVWITGDDIALLS